MNWYKTAQSRFPTTIEELNKLNYNETRSLAENRSITPECQMLLITSEYKWKEYAFYSLAENPSITHECQKLLITSEYKGKYGVLRYLAENPNFLKGFSLQDMREFYKDKGYRFHILSSRLKEVRSTLQVS